MKQTIIAALFITAVVGCSETKVPEEPKATVASVNTDTEKEEQQPELDSTAQMQKWTEYMTPGAEHKMLALYNGNWEAEVKMWMAPNTEPSKSIAQATNKMILGGRYQYSTTKGNFNGMQLDAVSITGYDNIKKKYISTWVDNFGTGFMNTEGSWDEATKTIHFKGMMMDATLGKEVPVRETFTFLDKDHQFFTMYAQGPDGKEFKTMEIMYVRKR